MSFYSGKLHRSAQQDELTLFVIDGWSRSSQYAKKLHRRALTSCEEWSVIGAIKEDDSPASAIACNDLEMTHPERSTALEFLRLFGKDGGGVGHALEQAYGVDISACGLGKEVVILAGHAEMPADSFHVDLCDDGPPGYKGLTFLHYAHDAWDPSWMGHFEIAGRGDEAVAGFAPLPNRSIIIDGCMRHRATNPRPEVVPLLNAAKVNSQFLGESGSTWFPKTSSSLFPSWRFAIVMQMYCWMPGFQEREL